MGTLDFPQLDFLTLGTETARIHRFARPQSAHRIRRRCVVGKSWSTQERSACQDGMMSSGTSCEQTL
jgi:hypothetical protein